MIVTGILPRIILPKEEDGIIIKGNDIDVSILENGKLTELSAIWLGNGDYEITELEDNADLLSEYDVGDIISIDAVKLLILPFTEKK